MTELEKEPRARSGFGRLEAAILIPNLVLLGGVLIYLATSVVGTDRVEPLVAADPKTASRIAALEEALLRDPASVSLAIELSRLYRDAGEFPWSYNALLGAERRGSENPVWRLRLGLAYLELGKNADGLRVITRALERCGVVKCPPPLRIKLDLFSRMARLFVQRKIDSRIDRMAAEKALREVFKPAEVDPAKMRPKAPVPEEPAQVPAVPKT